MHTQIMIHTGRRCRRQGFMDVTPMMMVPVFVIVITFFAFVAVRNEMIKDDISDIQAEIDAATLRLDKFREEAPKKISDAQVSIIRTQGGRENIKDKHREETRTYIAQQAEMEARIGAAEHALAEREHRIEGMRVTVEGLQEEAAQLRAQARGRGRAAHRNPRTRERSDGEDEDTELPYYSLFRDAEADNARVLRRFNLAVTRDDIQPVRAVRTEVWFRVEAPWYLLDVPRTMELLVDEYYKRVAQIDNWESHSDRWQTYLDCKDEHGDLRDIRADWLKDLKKVVDELEKIEKTTNARAKNEGYDVTYVSPYIEYLEQARKDLRKVEVKPPAEPKKRIGTTGRPYEWRGR